MAKKSITISHFHCTVCNKANYTFDLNKKNNKKLEMRKYCPKCRKMTLHKSKDTKS